MSLLRRAATILFLWPMLSDARMDCGTWALHEPQRAPEPRNLRSAPAARPADVGDNRTFFTHIPEGRPRATLRHIGRHATYWVDDGRADILDMPRLIRLAAEFDDVIYPQARAWFGSEWLPGVDGDARITVLLHDVENDASAAGFGGYFSQVDELPLEPESNAREMVYLDIFAVRGYDWFRLKNLFAHEFTHLLNWRQRGGATDERWLEEGRGAFAEWAIYGNIHGSFLNLYLNSPVQSLTSENAFGTWYGASFLLLMYLYDHFGGRPFAEAYGRVPRRGVAAIDIALAEVGRSERVADIFPQWALANLLNDRALTPLGGYRAVPAEFRVASSAVTKRSTYPAAGRLALREWSVAYVRLSGAPVGPLTFTVQGDAGSTYTATVWRPRTRDYVPLPQAADGSASLLLANAVAGETYTLVLTTPVTHALSYRVEQADEAGAGDGAPPLAASTPTVTRLRADSLIPARRPAAGALTPAGVLPLSADIRRIALAPGALWAAAGWGVARFDRGDPAHPVFADVIPTAGEARDVATDGATLYIAEDMAGIGVYDAATGAPIARANHGGSAAHLALYEDHLFVLNARTGLRAYDVSDPADPTLEQSLFSGTGYFLRAAEGRLYVSDGGNGFRVFSIAAMPAMPLEGLLEVIVLGAAPRQGIVWGGSGGLVGIDPGAPTGPEVVRTLGTTAQPRDVVVRGDTLVTAESEAGMRLVDVAAAPRTVGRVSTRGSAHAVALDGEWAYIADGPAGIAVMNVRDRFAPAYASHVDTSGLAARAHGSGGRVFVANGPGGLTVTDRSQVLAHVSTQGVAHDVVARGSLAYVATTAGLEVVDLTDMSAPVVGEPAATTEPASGVALSDGGAFAYVAAGDVVVFDVTNARPQRGRTLSLAGFASSVHVGGDLLAVAATEDGLELYDIVSPAAPQFLARVSDARNARAVVRHEDTLFVGAGEDVIAYDVTDLRRPAEINRWDAQFDVRVLATRDGRVFAGGETTVAGWDARSPNAPSLLFRDRTFRWVGGVALEGARLYVADVDRLHVFRREDDGALYVTDPVTAQATRPADFNTYVTAVGQSYPNPFNPETWVPFELARRSRVEVSIYNVAGRLVRTTRTAALDQGRYATRGRAMHWDGRNASGDVAPAGLYFYRFTALPVGGGAPFKTTGRMALAP